jgi:hypothetical protein
MRHPDIMDNVWKWSNMPKRPAQPPSARMRMPGADSANRYARFGDTQQSRIALSDSDARFERVMADMGRRNMSDTQTGEKIRNNLTMWGGPTTDARTWGQLQGIVPAARR